jgi:hypothetical protein
MAKWLFLERLPDRPAGGDAFRRMFERLDPEFALSREAIQNAVDAAEDHAHDQAIVEFEMRDDCDLRDLLGPPYSDHALARSFVDPDLELPVDEARRSGRVLLIHDYGTTGLTGGMRKNDMRSNFYRLMGGLGGSEKATGGGSYGFGKAAAILNSQLFTVFAYTVTAEGDGCSKFWGTSYLDPHKHDHEDYLGVGWFCHEDSDVSDPLVLQYEEADSFASRLRIRRVKTREVGTTIALIHPSTDLEALQTQIRENWWPRIAERANDAAHQLIYIREGETRQPISLERDNRIKPYLSLYEIARGIKEPNQEMRRYDLVLPRASGNVKLGVLGLSLNAAESQNDDVLEGVALVRKPKMVVTYLKKGVPSGIQGIFIADSGMDAFLRKTEPHEHDDWNERIPGPSLDTQRRYAKLIKSEIRKKVREFMDAYSPPPEAEPKLLPELRRVLGNLFSTSGVGPPPRGAEPVSITHKLTTIGQLGSKLKLSGSARFTNMATGAVSVKIGVEVKVVESDLGSGGDALPVTICAAGESRGPGEKPSVEHSLNPGDYVDLEFESEPYDSEWTTKAIFWSAVEN